MSWTEILADVDADAIETAEPVNDETTEALEQFEAARSAAAGLARSGVVGGDRFTVHLTGHATPGLDYDEEYNNVVQVSVAQHRPTVEEPDNVHDPHDEA